MKNTVNYDTINSQQNIKNIFTMSKTNFTRKYKKSNHLTPQDIVNQTQRGRILK